MLMRRLLSVTFLYHVDVESVCLSVFHVSSSYCSRLSFMVPGRFLLVFKLFSWFFMVLGRFLLFFKAPGQFLWVFNILSWFFMVLGQFLLFFKVSGRFIMIPSRFFMVPARFYCFSRFHVGF